MDKIAELKNLLAQLEKTKQTILNDIEIAEGNMNPYLLKSVGEIKFRWDDDTSEDVATARINQAMSYRQYLNYKKKYYLLTLTFSPSISNDLDILEQSNLLLEQIKKLQRSNPQQFTCLEKHKSGTLHSHTLICLQLDEHRDILMSIARMLGCKKKLHPAVNFKPVKDGVSDLDRVYNYIVENKVDHPVYKDLRFSY